MNPILSHKVLSIIIPIYNVEKYLLKCLDSVYSQGVSEDIFEVIAVVDGSPDCSINILNAYSQAHSNLLVLEKGNGGVSSARNLGIKHAQGKFLMFLDPDDSLIPGSLDKVIEKNKHSNCDIIIFRSFNEETKAEKYEWSGKVEEKVIYSGAEVYEKYGTRVCVWGGMYNTVFWRNNGIEFPMNIKNGEDSIVFISCHLKAQRMMFSDVKLYNVFTRPDSASHDITRERLVKWFETLEIIKKLKDECITSMGKSMYDGLSYSTISVITKHAIDLMGIKAFNFLMNNNIVSFLPISSDNINHSTFSNRILKLIANKSFKLFYLISYFRQSITKLML